MKTFSLLGCIVSLFICPMFIACNQHDSNEYEAPAEKEIKYEDAKLTIAQQEQQYPLNFLYADGQYRPALVGGNFLISGSIKSNATVTTYKDITLKVTYFSKTNSEISSENKTFYEFISPSGSYKFREKVWAPEGTTTIGFDVMQAKTR